MSRSDENHTQLMPLKAGPPFPLVSCYRLEWGHGIEQPPWTKRSKLLVKESKGVQLSPAQVIIKVPYQP